MGKQTILKLMVENFPRNNQLHISSWKQYLFVNIIDKYFLISYSFLDFVYYLWFYIPLVPRSTPLEYLIDCVYY